MREVSGGKESEHLGVVPSLFYPLNSTVLLILQTYHALAPTVFASDLLFPLRKLLILQGLAQVTL